MEMALKWSFIQLFIFNMLLRACYMDPIVETKIGVIKGNLKTLLIKGTEYKVHRYLGIPYAKAPVGELRFAKPQPAAKFDTPFEATSFGASCPQLETPDLPPIKLMSEDCLFLNVFVPESAPDMQAGHAVMIFVHGGGFSVGSADMYTGHTLAAFGNVIVVTINYRLGLWGLLTTGDAHAPGNYALWDQHFAFRWVNDNIGSFGGDNGRVTIFGQSAGSSAVSMQAFYPQNKGLFQRVIAESGSATIAGSYSTDPFAPTKFVAEQLGCNIEQVEEMVTCLRQKDSDIFLPLLNELMKDPVNAFKLAFMPYVDNSFIKFVPSNTNANEMKFKDEVDFFRSLDMINGVTKYEGGVGLYFLPIDKEGFKPTREEMNTQYVPMAAHIALGSDTHNVVTDMIVGEYTDWRKPDDPQLTRFQYVKLIGDVMFNIPFIHQIQLHANSSAEVNSYAYQFRPRPTLEILPSPSWVSGANHGDDLYFVFGFDEEMISQRPNEENTTRKAVDWEYNLAYNVITYWTNFAKSGNPNTPNPVVATWPKFNLEDQHYIALDKDMSADSATEDFPYVKEANFWLKVIPSVHDALRARSKCTSSKYSEHDDHSCKAGGDCDGQ